MSKLICTLDNRMIDEYSLNKERISIGRRQDNDIVIDNLAISGLHAYVVTIGEDSFLEDANSTNGTFVNLKPVKKHVLKHGDIIEIGRHQFKYFKEKPTLKQQAQHEQASTPLASTPSTQPPSLKEIIQKSKPALKEATQEHNQTTPMPLPASHGGEAKLRILNGTNTGKKLALNKTLNTLGKSGQQVVVITKRSNGYFLSQIEGPLPPTINGKSLSSLSQQLNPRDVIDVSGIKMEFFLE